MPHGVEVACMHRSVKCCVGEVVGGSLTLMLTKEITRYVAVIFSSMKNEDLHDATIEEGYPVADLTRRRQPRDYSM